MKRSSSVFAYLLTFVALSAGTAAPAAAQSETQFIPIMSYRTGPNAPLGSSLYGGWIDYLDLVNKRDGGVNGIKIAWEECETAYSNDRAIACYEKFVERKLPLSMVNPGSTATAYALLGRMPKDKVPMMTVGYGRPDASDGRVFPWIFPIITNYWSQSTAKIKYIALRSGGLPNLKGKTIVNLYHDSAYGKETTDILNLQAEKYGFKVVHIPVGAPYTDQEKQWDQIVELKPDWVILRGIGVMTPAALKTAAARGYPASRMIGVWWSGSEVDVLPAGNAAKGFITTAFNLSGRDFPVIRSILQRVYRCTDIEKLTSCSGSGGVDDLARIGTMYYNRGVVYGIISVEAIRRAQERFWQRDANGKPIPRAVTGEEVRWGLEHVSISNLRILELGGIGLMQPIKLSCFDHEGGGAVRFQRWDGKQWYPMTGWINGDREMVRAMVEQRAAEYAKKQNIPVRDCAEESRDERQTVAAR